MSAAQQIKSTACKTTGKTAGALTRRLAILLGCITLTLGNTASCGDIEELESVEGLRFAIKSNDVVLTWPSDPRESFVVLWRSNATWQTPWSVLTNQLPAFSNTNQTCFLHSRALSHASLQETETNSPAFYRVFVIPDFWFDLEGVVLSGGKKNPGQDFLPVYRGNKETAVFKPQVTLLVDGKDENFGEEDTQRVNFGTTGKPCWSYASGFWFRHDILTNGSHTLQLASLLTLSTFVGDLSQYVTLTNRPVKVRVTNEITYLGWQDLIQWSNYTFVAQSVEPRVNWRIDVYDTRGQLLISKTGQTTNGEIRWTWDLRDKEGKSHDDSDVEMSFPSTLTTWPIGDNSKAKERSPKTSSNQRQQTWWDLRLGRDFVRKEPSAEDRRRRFVFSEDHPLESRIQPRPWSASPRSSNDFQK